MAKHSHGKKSYFKDTNEYKRIALFFILVLILWVSFAIVRLAGNGPRNLAGRAERSCIPDCEGKSCGDDGCGGVCGSCKAQDGVEYSCNMEYQCEPVQ